MAPLKSTTMTRIVGLLAWLAKALRLTSSGAAATTSSSSTKQQPSAGAGGAGAVAADKDLPRSSGLCGEALALALKLRGRTLRIPDLRQVFADWPCMANEHEERLVGLVNSMLDSIISDERKLKGLKRADFARLIALWYPKADWAGLEVATAYSVWIFVWDDEIDASDTDVSTNQAKAHAYVEMSRNFTRRALGLLPPEEGADAAADPLAPAEAGAGSAADEDAEKDGKDVHPRMRLYVPVGEGMRASTDVLQRGRFCAELDNFMDKVELEHEYRMRGAIPTLEKYLDIRSGSVGCAPQIAITDYMLHVRLPESIMESEAMKSLWRETVIICLILNDIYSCQKEIAQGSFLNIVPVMFANLPEDKQDLDQVTEDFMAALHKAMENFEAASRSLEEQTADDAKVNQDTKEFIEWCRYFITGVLFWSLDSPRYGMAKCFQEDGSLSMVL